MATFLDIGLLEYFTPIFVFILIFILVYALLQKTSLLGGSQKLDFMLAVLVALLALISQATINFVTIMSTWYVILIVAVILMTLAISIGGKDQITEIPGGFQTIFWAGIVILVVSIGYVFGPVFTPYAAGADSGWWVLRTIFNPRIFGVLLIMLIALILINKLTEE